MSVKNWLLTFLILAIPFVGIIMLIVWAFGDKSNVTRSNYAKAALIMAAIGIVLYIIFIVIFMGIIGSMV